MKDNECAELSIQSQVLLEELEQLRNNYKLVSEFYDEAVQDSGAAKRDLKITQKQKEHQLNRVLSCLYPALSEATHTHTHTHTHTRYSFYPASAGLMDIYIYIYIRGAVG